jgi:simple sugar transport system ATP-binding protein
MELAESTGSPQRAARARGAAVVELRGISKAFGRVQALDDVSLTVASGEIHALLGENGAGKSTLMNVAYGLVEPDEGEVLVGGELIPTGNPRAALDAGIGMVHQHFKLVPSLTVGENIFLAREPRRNGLLDRRRAVKDAQELSDRHGLSVRANALVGDLSVGDRQRVEILRILSHEPRLIVLDEPTAVLAPQEVQDLFAVIRRLRDGGSSVVIVTHKLDEVRAIADRLTVMRRGRHIETRSAEGVSETQMAALMVGRDVVAATRATQAPRVEAQPGKIALQLRGLSVATGDGDAVLRDVNLSLRAGEVVGIAGVEGNGQSELAEVIAGLRRVGAGTVELDGVDVTGMDAQGRRARGLAYVPEDRFDRGGSPAMSIMENLALGNLSAVRRGPLVRRGPMRRWAEEVLADFDVRGVSDPRAPLGSLSGGNMQKVILARELVRDPQVLLASQPCRGVDVGAIAQIHQRLLDARANGMAILLISTELSEVMALSDRILVLYRGKIVAEVDGDEATREQLGVHMIGGQE